MPITLPPNAVVDAIHGSITRITRRVELYEFDAVTPWEPGGAGIDPSITDGKVDIDASRDERRTLQMVIYNEDDAYQVSPSGFWYDKVIKIYRGIEYSGGSWEQLLGQFYIDRLSQDHFPGVITVTARDRTKMVKKSKFAQDTLFNNNDPVRDVIEAIAFSAGIPLAQQSLPADMGSLYEETYFDVGEDHWSAMKDIATSFKYDLYFKPDGSLVAEQFSDPATQTPEYTFQTGPTSGNIASYSKDLTDDRLRNHIIITGESANKVPIYAEAENTDPASPTRIGRIGRRSEKYNFAYIGDQTQAQELANVYLSIASMEQYELSLEAIVAPYLDAGIVVGFIDPSPSAGDPTDFLLQTLSIPLGLSAMSATAGRVTLAG